MCPAVWVKGFGMLFTFVFAAVTFGIVNWSIISLVRHHSRIDKPLSDVARRSTISLSRVSVTP